jgi:L-ascorbate metabolism protein UlaG (beta-lactamase superfamily)
MAELCVENKGKTLFEQLKLEVLSNKNDVRLWWLGQAGFLIQYGSTRLLIDPYLSDYLAKKYANAEFKHIRMQPAPIDSALLESIGWVLCTHRHSDHMDPETLPVVMGKNSQCKLIYPRAENKQVRQIGIPSEKCIPVNAGETLLLTQDIMVTAVASAHEELAEDTEKNHKYLGYIIKSGSLAIYHSGDCVSYEGLSQILQRYKIDLALLPVNGRDENRRANGVPGNFTFDEALNICRQAEIPYLIPHHFGMFDFNTISVSDMQRLLPSDINVVIPETCLMYILKNKCA